MKAKKDKWSGLDQFKGYTGMGEAQAVKASMKKKAAPKTKVVKPKKVKK